MTIFPSSITSAMNSTVLPANRAGYRTVSPKPSIPLKAGSNEGWKLRIRSRYASRKPRPRRSWCRRRTRSRSPPRQGSAEASAEPVDLVVRNDRRRNTMTPRFSRAGPGSVHHDLTDSGPEELVLRTSFITRAAATSDWIKSRYRSGKTHTRKSHEQQIMSLRVMQPCATSLYERCDAQGRLNIFLDLLNE